MEIKNDLIGKEVLDESGDQVSIVDDVEWNFEINPVESIILKEGGISAKIGRGDKR